MKRSVFFIIIFFIVFYRCDLFEDENPYSGITETVIDSLNYWGSPVTRIIKEDPDDWEINYKPELPKDLLIPQTYQIGPAFPNPSIDSTFILVGTPNNRKIHIYIKDDDEKLVKTIINDTLCPGYHRLYWKLDDDNGKRVNSGLYRCFYKIENSLYIDSVYYSSYGHGDIKIE